MTRTKCIFLGLLAALLSPLSANGALYKFTYSYWDDQKVSGYFRGEESGDFIVNITDIEVMVDGIAYNTPLYAHGFDPVNVQWVNLAPVMSSNANLLNFFIADSSDFPASQPNSNYFFVVNWHLPGDPYTVYLRESQIFKLEPLIWDFELDFTDPYDNRVFCSNLDIGTGDPGECVPKFDWTLTKLTVVDQLEELTTLVIDINLEAGVSNSLDSKLNAAIAALDDTNEANDGAALNSLYAFCNSVSAQRGKKISDVQADDLIAAANRIIASIDEFAPGCD